MTSEFKKSFKLYSVFVWVFLVSQGLADEKRPNYHWVGWTNTFVPGAGQAMLGNYGRSAGQAAYEIGAFTLGYSLSNRKVSSLDGFESQLPSDRLSRTNQIGAERLIVGDILQEFGLKAHMVNTFDAYRIAARRANGGIMPNEIDSQSTMGLFLEPVEAKNLKNPWVYVPLLGTLSYAVFDYFQTVTDLGSASRLNETSNFLNAFNKGPMRAIGSGAPEEMFYRGFLQNEIQSVVSSPYLSIPVTSALFALSHSPNGRPSAFVSGAYLGFIANKYDGKLGPGITIHFWSQIILGVEAMLLYHKAQRITPPTAFNIQVSF